MERRNGHQVRRPIEARLAPVEIEAGQRLDLTTARAATGRPSGRGAWCARTLLTTDDLIWPLFLVDGDKGASRCLDAWRRAAVDRSGGAGRRAAATLAIPASRCSPTPIPSGATTTGSEALNPDNLVCRALRAIKKDVPEIGIICDVALDPYTSHGHDGLLRDGDDPQRRDGRGAGEAGAGAGRGRLRHHRAIGHDGWPRRRRSARRSTHAGFADVSIMAYAAKYASAFYGPFRDAVGSATTLTGDKRTYQMDPANTDEAMREVELDIAEGADMVMVKPGMPYLDILRRVKDAFGVPTFAYQVSGEYSMIMAAAQNGWLDGEKGHDGKPDRVQARGRRGMLSYFAPRVAEKLKKAG